MDDATTAIARFSATVRGVRAAIARSLSVRGTSGSREARAATANSPRAHT